MPYYPIFLGWIIVGIMAIIAYKEMK